MGAPFANLSRQFNDSALSDMIVTVETQNFFVSKVILALWSQPLAICISNAAVDRPQNLQLRLCNVDAEIVGLMLQFFYSSDKDLLYKQLTPWIAWKLLLLCDLLCVDLILNICQHYLKDWLLRYNGSNQEFDSSDDESNKEENHLRLVIILTCLRRDRYSPAFCILREGVLHLITNTPCSLQPIFTERQKQSSNEVSSYVSPTSTIKLDTLKATQTSSTQYSTPNDKLNSTADVAIRSIPSLLLRLQLMDLCSLLSNDSIQVDENTLMQWTLSYSAYYGKQLTEKFTEDMKKRNKKRSNSSFIATTSPSSTNSCRSAKTKRLRFHLIDSEIDEDLPCPTSKIMRLEKTLQSNDSPCGQEEASSIMDISATNEITLDCSPYINLTLTSREGLIPENVSNLNFYQLCEYFNLSALTVNQLLRNIVLHKIRSDYSKFSPASNVSQVSSVKKKQDEQSCNNSTVNSNEENKIITEGFCKNANYSEQTEDQLFLTLFFEGYIYASLEPYLRYSLLQPVHLVHLRNSPFCSKQMVTDAAFFQLSKQDGVPHLRPNEDSQGSNHPEVLDQFRNEDCTQFFVKNNLDVPRIGFIIPPFVIHHFQNRIFCCVKKRNFSHLPYLLSQYVSLRHRSNLFVIPFCRKQITTPRSIFPFKWCRSNASCLALSGHFLETVTARLAPSLSSQWSMIYADTGTRSGLHHWLIRINRSSLNNIIIGVMEFNNDENAPMCQCCFTSNGASRSLVLYSQKLYTKPPRPTINSNTSNPPRTNNAVLSQCYTECTGHLSVGFPIMSMRPQNLSSFQPMRNDIIVTRLDLRTQPGNLSFYCVRPNGIQKNEGTLYSQTASRPENVQQSSSVWLIGTFEDITTVMPLQREWRLFVNLHDRGDSISLLSHDPDIVNALFEF